MATERVDPMQARFAALEVRIEELEAQVERPCAPDPEPDPPVTRRRLMGMAGAAAVGAVGATVLSASPAGATGVTFGAADGDALQIGGNNTCASLTTLVSNGAFGFRGATTQTDGKGVLGDCAAGTGAIGVLGSTTTGTGVVGSSSGTDQTGVRGISNSGAAAKGVEGQSSSGEGVRGTTTAGGGAGVHGINNTGLGQGVWGESATGLGVFGSSLGAGQMGVYGVGNNNAASIGVKGESPTGKGVQGVATGANQVGAHGLSSNGNGAIGVLGESIAGGGIGLAGAGPRAQLFLFPNASVGAPTTGFHDRGEFFVDNDGALFYCVAPGVDTAASWVRQAPLVPLASPVRIYYSLTFPDPPLGNGLERSVTVTNGTTIPHTASAVLTNLAVTPAGADGFLAMFKDGTVWPGTSNVNFTAGQFASNNATSAIETSSGTGKVKIRCGGASVHFVIDVFGYYP